MFLRYSIADILRQFEDGSLDPMSIAEECISKVERFNPKYHAWVNFDADSLRRRALEAKSSLELKKPLRELEGIPVGIKDVFNTSEFPTEMGSEIWKGFTSGNDARVVYYIKNAGGLIAGKTITAEFAVHALNETLNPHNVEVTPGTSSSGSAVAVSLGMVPVALGTQTGASIIRPASFCGVYGFKPSFGLLPRTGSLKTTDSLDTVGFFVANPTDLNRIFDLLRVHGPNFPISYKALKDQSRQRKLKSRPWNIAIVKTHTWDFAPAYAQKSFLKFAHKLNNVDGVDVTELTLPPEFDSTHEIHAAIYDKSLSYYFAEEQRQSERISPVMTEMIERGNKISSETYYQSLHMQEQLISNMDNILVNYDACICLSTAGEPPKRNVIELPDSSLMWTLMHLPAINAPIFVSPSGLPFGLQLISRKYNDYLLLSFIEYLVGIGILPKRPTPIREFSILNH
jgi:Asp-tRNA(Asn)/Glu-tRNA(Gln) amidotransferase A subunit family amidase